MSKIRKSLRLSEVAVCAIENRDTSKYKTETDFVEAAIKQFKEDDLLKVINEKLNQLLTITVEKNTSQNTSEALNDYGAYDK